MERNKTIGLEVKNKLLEPFSFIVYFAILGLSVIIFVTATIILLLFLYLSYKDWIKLMQMYNEKFIKLERIPPEIDGLLINDLSKESTVKFKSFEDIVDTSRDSGSLQTLKVQETKKKKQKIEICARIANIYYPIISETDTSKKPGTIALKKTLKKCVEAIELEPSKMDNEFKGGDKIRHNYGPDREIGWISITLEHLPQNKELRIYNIQGEGVRKKSSQAILNPFITIYIWPDNVWSLKTKVVKKTNTPKWDDCIVISNFEPTRMAEKALHLKVQNAKSLKPNEVIGHLLLPLKLFQFDENEPFTDVITKNLQPNLIINRGAISLLLKFYQNNDYRNSTTVDTARDKLSEDCVCGQLELCIMKANIIYASNFISDQCQFFVRVVVSSTAGVVIAKYCSAIIRGSFEPEWNEKFTFDVPVMHHNLLIDLSVREENFSQDGRVFAYVLLGLKNPDADKVHLKTTLKYPGRIIAQWHQLISTT